MFLAAALAASPAGLFVPADERQNIVVQSRLHHFPKRFAAKSAAAMCLAAMRQHDIPLEEATRRLKHMWNDGSPRALDFPLYDAELPNDALVEKPREYFRVQGKQVLE